MAIPVSPLPNSWLRHAKCASRSELNFLFDEIHVKRQYDRLGVRILPGDTVLDIGANVGIFSTYASTKVGLAGKIVALEPLPATFLALEHNVSIHGAWCDESSIAHAPVVCIEAGVGDGTAKTANFTLYPDAGGWGTMSKFESPQTIASDMQTFLDNTLDGDSAALSPALRFIGKALRRTAPSLYRAIANVAVKGMLSGAQEHECRLVSISEILEEQGIFRVDLLKIDVERAEVEVLKGVLPHDWRRIAQASMEVHSENLEHACDILRGVAGFNSVITEQGDDMRGTSIHHVYCSRLLQ